MTGSRPAEPRGLPGSVPHPHHNHGAGEPRVSGPAKAERPPRESPRAAKAFLQILKYDLQVSDATTPTENSSTEGMRMHVGWGSCIVTWFWISGSAVNMPAKNIEDHRSAYLGIPGQSNSSGSR